MRDQAGHARARREVDRINPGHLKDEPVRFNDLARMVGGASKKMIAERLTHLEAHGLIDRRVLETRPLGVAYQMTTKKDRPHYASSRSCVGGRRKSWARPTANLPTTKRHDLGPGP